jgi:NADH dehydrogenase/NADH:ubiquinone oxidoreductase subunit G
VLPTCHLYEQEGSLTNFAGLVQPFEAGARPPKGARPDHHALAELANALGASLPLELKELRAALAGTDPIFAPLTQQPVESRRREQFPVHL